jgi:hypothetical protein
MTDSDTGRTQVQPLVVTDDRWVAMGQGSEDFVTDLWIGLNGR